MPYASLRTQRQFLSSAGRASSSLWPDEGHVPRPSLALARLDGAERLRNFSGCTNIVRDYYLLLRTVTRILNESDNISLVMEFFRSRR